ncbi:hypothetical protein BC828DRAFT_393461 [Blastocladiella britannica]|nr:hypothetical protein BC828DRAFT_393461 [Blastocladiella britannica]
MSAHFHFKQNRLYFEWKSNNCSHPRIGSSHPRDGGSSASSCRWSSFKPRFDSFFLFFLRIKRFPQLKNVYLQHEQTLHGLHNEISRLQTDRAIQSIQAVIPATLRLDHPGPLPPNEATKSAEAVIQTDPDPTAAETESAIAQLTAAMDQMLATQASSAAAIQALTNESRDASVRFAAMAAQFEAQIATRDSMIDSLRAQVAESAAALASVSETVAEHHRRLADAQSGLEGARTQMAAQATRISELEAALATTPAAARRPKSAMDATRRVAVDSATPSTAAPPRLGREAASDSAMLLLADDGDNAPRPPTVPRPTLRASSTTAVMNGSRRRPASVMDLAPSRSELVSSFRPVTSVGNGETVTVVAAAAKRVVHVVQQQQQQHHHHHLLRQSPATTAPTWNSLGRDSRMLDGGTPDPLVSLNRTATLPPIGAAANAMHSPEIGHGGGGEQT